MMSGKEYLVPIYVINIINDLDTSTHIYIWRERGMVEASRNSLAANTWYGYAILTC